MSAGMVLSYLVSGIMAEYLTYRTVAFVFGIFQLLIMYLLIVKPANDNRLIYEADRSAEESC